MVELEATQKHEDRMVRLGVRIQEWMDDPSLWGSLEQTERSQLLQQLAVQLKVQKADAKANIARLRAHEETRIESLEDKHNDEIQRLKARQASEMSALTQTIEAKIESAVKQAKIDAELEEGRMFADVATEATELAHKACFRQSSLRTSHPHVLPLKCERKVLGFLSLKQLWFTGACCVCQRWASLD